MAEQRPATLDQMARIGGVGAKKLERYGAEFLGVINGATEEVHPARRRLAGRNEGALYDRLLEIQAELSRGCEGIDKPLSCSAAQLAKVARLGAGDEDMLTRLLGERRAERFGAAFMEVLREAG